MGKEKSPSKKEVPKETYPETSGDLHHDPAPADGVGSAGGLECFGSSGFYVYSHVRKLNRSISHLILVTDGMYQLTDCFLEDVL